MRGGITEYDILFSCPNDVVELKHAIQECIDSFNNSLGKVNSIRLNLKHWSNSSFPQYGERPQGVLNKQFIEKCDLCVALFGSRFGTSTGEYDSGTEEEIKNMISQKKQVFLYFYDKSIEPSKIDIEQLGKVQEFKKNYQGLYAIIKSDGELRIKFLSDLMLYFINMNYKEAVHEDTVNLVRITDNLCEALRRRDPLDSLAELFEKATDSVQVAILKNLFKICQDVDIIDYNETLLEAHMFLERIAEINALKPQVKVCYDKVAQEIEHAFNIDCEELWQDSGCSD
ncbi:MAG: hypothetical protein J1F39_00995 [Clostridiales bacterium]|nr:hypothetical protein [Clostridiales bacterium]